tara:strand:- start:30228 stop:31166 length:939 start_codon:yes stop_codon:yes gene_type:complete
MQVKSISKCCNNKAVIDLSSGEQLCKEHFIRYFESKVLKTIRKFELIGKEENLGVALSGGKDSLTVLNILNNISKENRKIKLTAVLIDEGIAGYRDKTIIDAENFCNEKEIELKIFSYKEEFGYTLDEILRLLDVKPCTVCGIFRRYLLNKKSRELGFTKLVTGHNLDDECQSIMMNQFKNNLKDSAKLGPINGVISDNGFVPRIKPLYLCAEKEVATYAFVNELMRGFNECPNLSLSQRSRVRDMLNEYENEYSGTKYAIANSFLQMLPGLKEKFKFGKLEKCKDCGEPSSKEICNTCVYLKKLLNIKKLD